VSAIAHWIEQHGIRTVVIGLVRLHLEKILPPRSLWVPFELGRPLGSPSDKELQQRVLLQALRLVETTTAQRIIDFDEEDSRTQADSDWQAPQTGNPVSTSVECARLQSAFDHYSQRSGRTSVGVAGVPIEQCASMIDHAISEGAAANSPREGVSDVLMLRLAIDDIKAYYSEAALNTGRPSSRQIGNWFWLDTYVGTQLRQLRENLIGSDDVRLEGLFRRFVIPHRWRISD